MPPPPARAGPPAVGFDTYAARSSRYSGDRVENDGISPLPLVTTCLNLSIPISFGDIMPLVLLGPWQAWQ